MNISRVDIVRALKLLKGESQADPTGLYNKIITTLKVYETKGEWDRSVQSAMECLELAGFEVKELK